MHEIPLHVMNRGFHDLERKFRIFENLCGMFVTDSPFVRLLGTVWTSATRWGP